MKNLKDWDQLYNQALDLQFEGKLDLALDKIQKALQIVEAESGLSHEHTATVLWKYGDILIDLGLYLQAEKILKRCLKIAKSKSQGNSYRLKETFISLGYLYRHSKKFAKSEDCFSKALKLLDIEEKPSKTELERLLDQLVIVLEKRKKIEQAIVYRDRIIDLKRSK